MGKREPSWRVCFRIYKLTFIAMKTYSITNNIGKAKYLINYHDGINKHSDGSPFFDIITFKNKKDLAKAEKDLQSQGYLLNN